MNSSVDAYLRTVIENNRAGLEAAKISLSSSLPCYVARELEVPDNSFVNSSEPFMISYKALHRNQNRLLQTIPRKREFEAATYVKEGIIV